MVAQGSEHAGLDLPVSEQADFRGRHLTDRRAVVPFPLGEGFLFGVATSAMQCEGNLEYSNWAVSRFWRVHEAVGQGSGLLRSIGSDLLLARDMGLGAFRLSLEWSRIEREPGQFDDGAIAHYQDNVAECQRLGLEPLVTLWHFSYPKWLDRSVPGGWRNPAVVAIFRRYAAAVSRAFPNVRYWFTVNEPNAFAINHCLLGIYPPAYGPASYAKVLRHVVAAHAAAYQVLKRDDPSRRVSANAWHFESRLGRWPHTPDFVARLLPLDFISFDYYAAHWPWEWPLLSAQWRWPVHPPGLERAVMSYWERFGLPIMIAENGLCEWNWHPRPDGWTREAYLVHHLYHLGRARARGAHVLGYMHWSLMDSWEMGRFAPRFGLYRVDYDSPDLSRIPTPAVEVYREIATAGGVPLSLGRQAGLTIADG